MDNSSRSGGSESASDAYDFQKQKIDALEAHKSEKLKELPVEDVKGDLGSKQTDERHGDTKLTDEAEDTGPEGSVRRESAPKASADKSTSHNRKKETIATSPNTAERSANDESNNDSSRRQSSRPSAFRRSSFGSPGSNSGKGGLKKTPSYKHRQSEEDGKVAANVAYKPTIMLEVLSGRAAVRVLIATYIFAIMGLIIDTYSTYSGLSAQNLQTVGAQPCSVTGDGLLTSNSTWGCILDNGGDNNTFHGVFTDLTNVLTVSMQSTVSNYSIPADGIIPRREMAYDSRLWACYRKTGCGESFASGGRGLETDNEWLEVLAQDDQLTPMVQRIERDVDNVPVVHSYLQYFNIFQNEEAIPTNGLIKSYYTQITFLNQESKQMISNTTTTFSLKFGARESGLWVQITTALISLMCMGSICTIVVFTMVMRRFYTHRGKKWLPEQQWCFLYLLCVIMYQNPIYLIQNVSIAGSSSALAAYVFSFFAQSVFLSIWFFYADGINYPVKSFWEFYLPKIGFGFMVFLSAVVLLAYEFPSYTVGTSRSPVEAVSNWEEDEKTGFVVASLTFLVSFVLFSLIWCGRLIVTYRQLNTLPYMATRYQQLFFRFFLIQASLVALFYVFQYALAVYYMGSNNLYDTVNSIDYIADGINALFRQQTELFGKTMFLSVYGVILAFLLLPCDCMEDESRFQTLFAVSEKEQQSLQRSREKEVNRKNKSIVDVTVLLDNHRKVYVFCIDLALSLLNVAWESYLTDEEDGGVESVKKSLAESGHTFVAVVEDVERDTSCLIARHTLTNRLVIGFRGTRSKKNMDDNLKYSKRRIDFENMPLLDLDKQDELIVLLPEEEDKDKDKQETSRATLSLGRVGQHVWDASSYASSIVIEGGKYVGGGLNSIIGGAKADVVDAELNEEGTNSGPSGLSSQSGEAGQAQASSSDNSDDTAVTAQESIVNKAKSALMEGGQMLKEGTQIVAMGAISAASRTPGLKKLVVSHVHEGFCEAYESLRFDLHEVVREEVRKNGVADMYFTGHSLGGAMATLAAKDFHHNTVPRLDAHLRHLHNKRSVKLSQAKHTQGQEIEEYKGIRLGVYNYGSPRVGDGGFYNLYNHVIPNSFRVVVDGDMVTGVPKTLQGFRHIGTQILIDDKGVGNIIVDPSFVERWLRVAKGASISAHLLGNYRIGLEGVRWATLMGREAQKQGEEQLLRAIMDASGRNRKDSYAESAVEADVNMEVPLDVENPLQRQTVSDRVSSSERISEAPLTVSMNVDEAVKADKDSGDADADKAMKFHMVHRDIPLQVTASAHTKRLSNDSAESEDTLSFKTAGSGGSGSSGKNISQLEADMDDWYDQDEYHDPLEADMRSSEFQGGQFMIQQIESGGFNRMT